MKRWEGFVVGLLILGGLALSVAAGFGLVNAALSRSPEREAAELADAARRAWASSAPFLIAALMLLRGGMRATAVVVAVMALLNLLTVIRHDGSGLILQVIAAIVAAFVGWKEAMRARRGGATA